jgi:hypothetical protein
MTVEMIFFSDTDSTYPTSNGWLYVSYFLAVKLRPFSKRQVAFIDYFKPSRTRDFPDLIKPLSIICLVSTSTYAENSFGMILHCILEKPRTRDFPDLIKILGIVCLVSM